MDKGWIQFLLIVVPVLSLIGSWLALKTFAERTPNDATRSRTERQ